jgi:hypothetical protein
MGFIAAMVFSWREFRNLSRCLLVSVMAAGLAAFAVLALAFEGVICIAMSVSVVLPLALLGGAAGYAKCCDARLLYGQLQACGELRV